MSEKREVLTVSQIAELGKIVKYVNTAIKTMSYEQKQDFLTALDCYVQKLLMESKYNKLVYLEE